MARNLPRTMLAVTVLVVPLMLGSSTALGQPQEAAPGDSKEKADKDADKSSAIRRAAEQLVDTIELEVLADDKWSKAKRLEKPLLLYSDDTRYNDRGSVWAWCDKGRPRPVETRAVIGRASNNKFIGGNKCESVQTTWFPA